MELTNDTPDDALSPTQRAVLAGARRLEREEQMPKLDPCPRGHVRTASTTLVCPLCGWHYQRERYVAGSPYAGEVTP